MKMNFPCSSSKENEFKNLRRSRQNQYQKMFVWPSQTVFRSIREKTQKNKHKQKNNSSISVVSITNHIEATVCPHFPALLWLMWKIKWNARPCLCQSCIVLCTWKTELKIIKQTHDYSNMIGWTQHKQMQIKSILALSPVYEQAFTACISRRRERERGESTVTEGWDTAEISY